VTSGPLQPRSRQAVSRRNPGGPPQRGIYAREVLLLPRFDDVDEAARSPSGVDDDAAAEFCRIGLYGSDVHGYEDCELADGVELDELLLLLDELELLDEALFVTLDDELLSDDGDELLDDAVLTSVLLDELELDSDEAELLDSVLLDSDDADDTSSMLTGRSKLPPEIIRRASSGKPVAMS